MKLRITSHAMSRMKTRGISDEDLMNCIKRPDSKSKRRGKLIYRKNLGKGIIEAIAEE